MRDTGPDPAALEDLHSATSPPLQKPWSQAYSDLSLSSAGKDKTLQEREGEGEGGKQTPGVLAGLGWPLRYSGCVSAAWHSSPPLPAAAHGAKLLSTPSPLFSALCTQLIGLLQSSQLPPHWYPSLLSPPYGSFHPPSPLQPELSFSEANLMMPAASFQPFSGCSQSKTHPSPRHSRSVSMQSFPTGFFSLRSCPPVAWT